MKLTFIGADHEVTGSCHLIEACGKKMLIDCGMEQGPDLYENQEIPAAAGDIDFVLLTHAHIDHSGKIPMLCKEGFSDIDVYEHFVYWTDSANTWASGDAWSVSVGGSLSNSDVSLAPGYGVRPVVRIMKSNL